MLLARSRLARRAPWHLGLRAAPGGGCGGSELPASAAAAARAKRGAATSAPDGDGAPSDPAAVEQLLDGSAAPPDLDCHAPAGERWCPEALPQRWLVFSDLHVSHKTRATALAVLERVHEEAAKRGAGIAFLGGWRVAVGPW